MLPSEGFDLCIVDAMEYGRRPELARGGGDRPPMLLVVSREEAEGGVTRLAQVDDFVVAPLDPIELSARVDQLLAARERETPEVRALEAAIEKSVARLADERRMSELEDALANEMTGFVVHGSSAIEFIARGAANWIRLFPGSFSAVLLGASGARAAPARRGRAR